MRRLKQDQNEHAPDSNCACLHPEDRRAFGRVFSRFADHPKACGCVTCGNPRNYEKNRGRTRDELRAELTQKEDLDMK